MFDACFKPAYWEVVLTRCTPGLIKRKDVMLVETTSVWQGLRRTLRLIDDRVDVSKPDDMAYVSAGVYAYC